MHLQHIFAQAVFKLQELCASADKLAASSVLLVCANAHTALQWTPIRTSIRFSFFMHASTYHEHRVVRSLSGRLDVLDGASCQRNCHDATPPDSFKIGRGPE